MMHDLEPINAFDLIHVLGRAVGADKVIKLKTYLQASPLLVKVFKYTYDQRKRYYAASAYITDTRRPVSRTLEDVFPLLDDLSSRSITGQDAKDAINDMVTSLTLQDAEIFKRILKKDLRCGVGPGIIKQAMGDDFLPRHAVMKAYNIDMDNVIFPIWVSYKLDFLRATLENGQLLSSGGKPFAGVDHILDELKGAPVLDGELTIPGMEFNKASGLLRSDKNCPNAVFMLFDAPEEQTSFFLDRLKVCQRYKNEHVKLIKHKLVGTHAELEAFYLEARALGYEGIVAKAPLHPYVKKRSKAWLKYKPEITLDGRIQAILPGTGRNADTFGALRVQHVGPDYKGAYVTDVSGFSDEMRAHIMANKDTMLGRWIEFGGMEFTPDNKVRHPFFVRFREDLD